MTNKLLDRFETATAKHMARIKNHIGHVYMDGSNPWTLHSCNDLGVPYFYKTNYGNPAKQKLFTVTRWRHITDLPEVE